MSRPVNISDSLTFTPAAWVSGSYYSISGQTNPIGQGSNNSSNYAQVNLTRGSNATTEAIWSFNCSSIPEGATITSISCSAKCSINNVQSSRIATRQAQLYSGTTAKGSAYTVANSTTAFNITCGTWTRAELQNARIRLYAVRGTSSTNSSYYFRFYGATLTVNYSLSGTEYEVSISNTSETVTSDPSTTQYVFQGGSQEISFYNISSLDDVVITDNSNDIESQLVHSTEVTRSITLVPSSFVSSTTTVTNQNNACTDTSSTTYARMPIGQQEENNMIYSFDVSQIPSNATINSISCVVKVSTSSSSNITTKDVQLYSGTSPKGSIGTIPTTTGGTVTLSPGTWTRQELENIRIRFDGYYGGTNSNYNIDFYGADLTVNYTVVEDVYTYTISNISADHSIVIEDVSGYNITCTDNSTFGDIAPTGTQTVEEGQSVVYTLTSSDFSRIKLTDNGVDVTSQIVHSQSSGSGSPVFIPSSYYTEKPNGESGYVADGITNGNNGLNNTSNNSPATLYSLEHGGYEWASFHISVSGIPEGAIIDSVTCKVKVTYIQSGVSANDNKVQLYSGNTPKGTPTLLTYNQQFNGYLDIGTWTLEELQDVRLYVCGYGKQVSQGSDFMRFYGAELTVTYHSIAGHTYTISNVSAPHTIVLEDSNDRVYIKVNGNFVQVNAVYKKINGVWVEQSDMSSLFDNNHIYVTG